MPCYGHLIVANEGDIAVSTINIFKNSGDVEAYSAGDVIFNVGDPTGPMYAVKDGEIEIIIGDKVIETIGPGGIVGEMALIDDSPRSALVRAKTDCHLVPISKDRFQFLVQQTPFFAINVMTVLAERLRRHNPTT
jgi:CRP-like cAMP-binding protein